MNAFDIPAQSIFATDPAFFAMPRKTHQGAPVDLVRKLAAKPKPVPRIAIDLVALIAYRQTGASYQQCADKFGVKPGFIKCRLVGVIKPPKPPAPPKAKQPRQRAARGTTLAAYEVRLTPEQRAFVKQQGGAVWLRALIDAQRGLDNSCFFVKAGDSDREALS